MATAAFTACDENGVNKLLGHTFDTPHNVPPFEDIRYRDYVPAIQEALKEVDQTVSLIVSNRSEATFENTIVPFDRRNEHLAVVEGIFFNISETENCDTLTVIAETILPQINDAEAAIYTNKALFSRIKHVYDNRSSLDTVQQRVVDKYYKAFVRNGALLSQADQDRLRELNNKISLLTLQFNNNKLEETNDYKLVIDTVADLSGLPESLVSAAAEAAQKAGLPGKWVFTLHNASIMPFLQYSDRHELRKQIYDAYIARGTRGNAHDNRQIILDIVKLRAQRAAILGYKSHAHYVIEENMAATPEAVDSFLTDLWKSALVKAKSELNEMKNFAWRYDHTTTIESCDWSYWAEKLRKAKYDVEERVLSEYFALENVQQGLFDVVNKLYGLTLKRIDDIPHYNAEDNSVYEVFEADGSYLGLVYFDFHPRSTKSSGAWCTSFRDALDNFDGSRTPAQVSVCYNFTKPTADAPALLTYDEVQTMYHEFGHALHSLFSTGKYRATCGNVPRDYVEMPSQILENWSRDPEVMKSYAKHYKTGEVIPDELIAKLQNVGTFNQGFATVEYIAASLLDLRWHMLTADDNVTSVEDFEKQFVEESGLIAEIEPRYHSTYFSHIFGGGYSAGYYVYMWAELIDADAFSAFKESGDLFNPALTAPFRKYCLSEIGNDDTMTQYVRFRGQRPSINALLARRGLK